MRLQVKWRRKEAAKTWASVQVLWRNEDRHLALLENTGPARPTSCGQRPANKENRAADVAACTPVLSFFSLTRIVNTQLKMQISQKTEKINETKSQLFERINKINKPLDRLNKEKQYQKWKRGVTLLISRKLKIKTGRLWTTLGPHIC